MFFSNWSQATYYLGAALTLTVLNCASIVADTSNRGGKKPF